MIPGTKQDTREKLIQVAIKLFAEHGFSGVSMRNINNAAGTKNSSAVHYHFGSKMGIIEAIMDRIDQLVAPVHEEIFEDLEKRFNGGKLTVEDVLMGIQLPFWVLYSAPEWGRYAVKLCARLMLEADEDLKQLYNRYLSAPVGRMYEVMHRLQPEKDENQLRFQLSHCFMSTIAGSASIDLMDNTPLGDIRFEDNTQLALATVFYLANGLGCDTPDYSRLDMAFWMKYAKYLDASPKGVGQPSLEEDAASPAMA